MSIRTRASGASAWRGYEYYTEKRVVSFSQTGPEEYEGLVSGRNPAPYEVKINTAHVTRSKCNCPHAEGHRRICKHMVALFFAVFPHEAEQYIAEIEEQEREEGLRIAEHQASIRAYVNSLSKKELREQLYEALMELEGRQGSFYWAD